jgi:hypothetical protein
MTIQRFLQDFIEVLDQTATSNAEESRIQEVEWVVEWLSNHSKDSEERIQPCHSQDSILIPTPNGIDML